LIFINAMARNTFTCIDAHTCGNPVRVVAEGGPELDGASMADKRQHFLKEYDWIRKGLMFEPRGHDQMSGSILYQPSNPENDAAILFIETSGCLPMCGHGLIGTVTVAIEEGLITPKHPNAIRIEVPAGLVEVEYNMNNKKVSAVKFKNVASFLHSSNLKVACPDLGELLVDVAYGGNFYAIIDAQKNFQGIENHSAADLISWSPIIRERLNQSHSFSHPKDPTINSLTHILWTGKASNPEADAKNAVFYGAKAIDRSPCGTGTSARMAQLCSKGLLKKGDTFVHESYIGSLFTGKVEEVAMIGDKSGIIPSIEGWAKVTGYNKIIIDDGDPYAHGFQVI